jgi:Flp pilus assembly pilin Flp
MKTVLRFLKDERGTETVEWAIVIGIIAIGAILAAASIGGKVETAFKALDTALTGAGS